MQRTAIGFALAAAVLSSVVGAAQGASVVINEVDYDQPSTDTAEFIELKNVSAAPVNLDNLNLILVNGNAGGAVTYLTIDLPAVMLAAGDYYVVCASTVTTINCDLDVSPDTNLIQNGAPDGIGLFDTISMTLWDAVSYEGNTGAPYTEGSGAGLDDNGVSANSGISRYPDGTDTNVNNVDLSVRCITPGTANSEANAGCQTPVAVAPTPWTQVKHLYR